MMTTNMEECTDHSRVLLPERRSHSMSFTRALGKDRRGLAVERALRFPPLSDLEKMGWLSVAVGVAAVVAAACTPGAASAAAPTCVYDAEAIMRTGVVHVAIARPSPTVALGLRLDTKRA
jgi:predicted phage tail protein